MAFTSRISYTLTRQVLLKAQNITQLFLQCTRLAQHCLGPWASATPWFRTLGLVEVRYGTHLLQLLQETGPTDLDSGLHDTTMQQPQQRQRQHAAQRMDPDLAVGPMENRPELHQCRILQVPEGPLHMLLTPVPRDDLLVGPTVIVREQDAFAQDPPPQFLEGLL